MGCLAAFATGSIAIKSVAGVAPDGWVDPQPGIIEAQIEARLRAEGFSTNLHPMRYISPIVYGERQHCRVSARDARAGEAMSTVFEQEAKSIGPVRYLYRGREYATPPGLIVRVGRIEAEILNRLRIPAAIHIPIALATSRDCKGTNVRLSDVRIPS